MEGAVVYNAGGWDEPSVYATPADNDVNAAAVATLYSTPANRPNPSDGEGRNGGATLAAADGANYDVAVHQAARLATTAEYSHLAPLNDAGQRQQADQNNHYDAGNPHAAKVAKRKGVSNYSSVA